MNKAATDFLSLLWVLQAAARASRCAQNVKSLEALHSFTVVSYFPVLYLHHLSMCLQMLRNHLLAMVLYPDVFKLCSFLIYLSVVGVVAVLVLVLVTFVVM